MLVLPGIARYSIGIASSKSQARTCHNYYNTDDCLQVPVTQRPYTVHVPQNVPVNFVPVSVPRQDLPGIQVIEQDPFTYCEFHLLRVENIATQSHSNINNM